MTPEDEIARKAGVLPKLELYRGLYNDSKLYAGILLFLTASGSAFLQNTIPSWTTTYSMLGSVLISMFGLMGVVARFGLIPRLIRESKKRVFDAQQDGSEEAELIHRFLGASAKKMFDEGFRGIKRSKEARTRDPRIDVMGRGFFSGGAVATAEEFAVLLHGETIAMSRVIAIDADSVWMPGSTKRFEGGEISGLIFGTVARSKIESHMFEGDGPPLEVVCLGLQSASEPIDLEPHRLSAMRARRLSDVMTSEAWVWHDSHNLRVTGIDLGKALDLKEFGSEAERRQRSAIIVFLARDLSFDRVFSFNSAIHEILGVSAVNGVELSGFELSDKLDPLIPQGSSAHFPSKSADDE